MANIIQYATLFQKELDKAAIHDTKTGWMDANAGKVKYTGGKEVKIPQLSVDGLGDYDRGQGGGYTTGNVTLTYKTYEMTQDRGRKFEFDAMDVEESNFIVTAGNVMGEFQREKVVPEIDAYRLSKCITTAMTVDDDKNVKYGYEVSKTSILEEIKYGIKVIRENGYNGTLIIHLNYDAMNALEMALSNKITSATFSQGGIDTKVPAIDQCPLIDTPSNRMYSSITLYDGISEGQKVGGYTKGELAKDCNFVILPKEVPLAVTKQNQMRIFDPNTYQDANAWSVDYRRYHDLWILDNKKNSIYANIKDAK